MVCIPLVGCKMQHLSFVERVICQEILGAADARFLSVSLWDGEEWAVKPTRDFARVKAVIGATEESVLRFRDASGEVVGAVTLYHGNGPDVLGDWTDTPEMNAMLASANAMAVRFGPSHV